MFEMDKGEFWSVSGAAQKRTGDDPKAAGGTAVCIGWAVSNWERGLSLPDVSLLLPLSQLLGVSVTELLEGRQLEEPMAPEEVETWCKRRCNIRRSHRRYSGFGAGEGCAFTWELRPSH